MSSLGYGRATVPLLVLRSNECERRWTGRVTVFSINGST